MSFSIKKSVRNFLPQKLERRLNVILIAPLVFLQLVAFWVFFDRNWDIMTKKLADAIARDLNYAIHLVQSTPPEHRQETLDIFAQKNELTLHLSAPHALPHISMPEDYFWGYKRFFVHQLSAYLQQPFFFKEDERMLFLEISLAEGVLQAQFRRSLLYSSTTLLFILFIILGAALSGFITFLLARNQARPMVRLAHAMDDFGKNKKNIDMPPLAGSQEVRLAIQAFKGMRNRLNEQMTQKNQLLTAISHDLNTALTRLKLNLALMKQSSTTKQMEKDILEIQRMIDDYIAFIRSNKNEKKEQMTMQKLWTALKNKFAHHTIKCDDSDFMLIVKPKQFLRCLSNIVDNATHYSKKIELSAKRHKDKLTLIIDDNGCGIPKHERKNVFDPFYRLEPSRNKKTGGLGLGLSITRDIVHDHQGDIVLEDSPLGGLRVRLTFPVVD